MWLIERLAEARIQQAICRGEFDNLPGAGEPLELDNDAQVPEGLRALYRLLKHSGFVPPEIEWRREIADIEDRLRLSAENTNTDRVRRRLLLLKIRLEQSGKQGRLVEV